MKKILNLVLLLTLAVASHAQRVLTLDSCRALALANNKELRMSQEKIKAAHYEQKAAFTNFLPKIDVAGTYMRTQKEISLLSDAQQNAIGNMGTAVGGQLQQLGGQLQQIAVSRPELLPLLQPLSGIMGELPDALNKVGEGIVDAFRTDTRNLYAGAAKDEMKEIAIQEPDKGISVKHPFVTFRIPENSTFLKAEGITNGKVMSEAVWSEPGRPAQIKIEHEARALKADGSDLIRLQVSVLDENGMIVEKENSPLSFSIEGHGQLIGENPVNLVAGQHIILVQSGYVPGELTIQASACGLTSQPCVIKVVKADDDMLFPVGFNAEEPTKISYEVAAEKSKRLGREKVDAFSFEAVTDAEPGAYVESSAVLLSGFINPVPIKIKGGEYRIYVSEYTDQNGEVQPGDAVFVRVKASETPGKTVKARVTIGNRSAEFKVTTKK